MPFAGTELEFIVFDDTYRQAWAKGYRGLTAASDYNIDYALLASTRMEPLLRDIRLAMDGAGMYCEGVKGECNLGQQEIAFRYAHALTTCDNHALYKNGAKEIADAHGKALTFMAKFNEREGNSCHIHLSVRGTDGSPAMSDPARPHGFSPLMEHFLAGQLAAMRELTLFFAPNINSYKRYQDGSFAPTAVAWGLDNRTCSLRVVGRGQSLRFENRAPGGDVNQYLAVAAMIAAGIDGIERRTEPGGRLHGQHLRQRQAAPADHAGRGGGAIRRVRPGPDGLRRGRRGALPEQRARRAGGVQRRRDGLGAGAGVRAWLRRRRVPSASAATGR